jgi:O-succinylbenzoic acid--CoA ligase
MHLLLNNSSFKISKETLPELEAIANEPWQQDIVFFLKAWFDNTDYIEQNTSGSTGTPKSIRLPKKVMLQSAKMTNAFFGLNTGSKAFLCLPASYIAGKMMLVRALAGNYTLTAVEPTSNPFATESMPTQDFTAITPYQLLHSANDIPRHKPGAIIVGGSPVTPAMENLIANWPIRIYETFGMTETASHIALRALNGEHFSSYFHALEGVKLSLDQRGCLVISAPHLADLALTTNDLVELKDPYCFRWLGRIDRVINTGGVKIFPEQVERKLLSIIQVPFFIAAQAHESLGQQVVLVIETPVMSADEKTTLLTKMKSVLHRFELPGQIHTLPGFVYSEGNKVLREQTLFQSIKY